MRKDLLDKEQYKILVEKIGQELADALDGIMGFICLVNTNEKGYVVMSEEQNKYHVADSAAWMSGLTAEMLRREVE